MACPRCGEALTFYRLGNAETETCEACAFVGIELEHRRQPRSQESWDHALERFRRRGDARVGSSATAEPHESRPEAALAALEVPGTEDAVPGRREAIGRIYDRLVNLGSARRAELLEVVDPADVQYASAESFWRHAARAGLATLPGVEPPGEGERDWRYDPDRV